MAKVYKCSFCQCEFTWSEGCKWLGSMWDLENNPSKIKYSCSKLDCQELLKISFEPKIKK
ncbi:MAG TPA: hypothetical protein DGG95_08300 [Cytophagales bacterium]|nr:hypothetical protein [Cytophagales bacterium]